MDELNRLILVKLAGQGTGGEGLVCKMQALDCGKLSRDILRATLQTLPGPVASWQAAEMDRRHQLSSLYSLLP